MQARSSVFSLVLLVDSIAMLLSTGKATVTLTQTTIKQMLPPVEVALAVLLSISMGLLSHCKLVVELMVHPRITSCPSIGRCELFAVFKKVTRSNAAPSNVNS